MLNLLHVLAFVKVVENGSFMGAARNLGMSQPAVTSYIQRLEGELGSAILVRSNARTTATPAGERFLPHAYALLAAEQRSKDVASGKLLSIGAASNIGVYYLPGILQQYLRISYADKSPPNLNLTVDGNAAVTGRLQRGEIDLALVEWWKETPGFDAVPWLTEKLVVIFPSEHRFSGRKQVSVRDLAKETLIGGERQTGTATLLRDTLGSDAGGLKATFSVGSTEAVKRAVAAGLGVSLVLEGTIQDELQHGKLGSARLSDAPLMKQIFAAFPKNMPASTPSRGFLDYLLEHSLPRK